MVTRALRGLQGRWGIEAKEEEWEKLALKENRDLKGQEATLVFQGQREMVVCQVWMDVREFLACQVPRAPPEKLETLGKLAFKDSLVYQEAQGQKVVEEKRVILDNQASLGLWDLQANRVIVENKENLDPSGLLDSLETEENRGHLDQWENQEPEVRKVTWACLEFPDRRASQE